jgi:HlyD family secretion protein
MKRYVRVLAVVLGLAALGAAGFFVLYMRPLAVEVARWEKDVPIQVYSLGTVEARIVSDLGFEVGNTLVELDADHGDRVAKDDVLARLHQREQEARVAKAAAELARAKADLEMAHARVEQAAAGLAQKRQANRRRQDLVGGGGVSMEVAEEAQMDVVIAEAELVVARSDVAVAEADLANAQAQFGLEQVMLEHYTLRAPYDAVVVERHKGCCQANANRSPIAPELRFFRPPVGATRPVRRSGGL